MSVAKWVIISLALGLLTALSAVGVMADSRINVWSHFGGDALYCDHDQGCSALNMSGNPLWSVPEAAIVKAVADSCASNTGIAINAGQGTYGPMTLWISCPNAITFVGFDEWGKQNTLDFTTDYLPVNPANDPHNHHHHASSAPETFECSVDLAGGHFSSVDGIHAYDGYDIWSTTENGELISFQHWSETDEGQPSCDLDA